MNYPNIEAERARLNMTNQELADALSVNLKTLYNWQHGKHVMPISRLVQLCELFQCTADYLIGRLPRERDAS